MLYLMRHFPKLRTQLTLYSPVMNQQAVAATKKLIMYVDCLDKYTRLLTKTEITTSCAKAETITNVVLNELKPKGIYIHKTIVISNFVRYAHVEIF